MNLRIKELAVQAGIHPSNFEPDADIKEPLEKFAELIVRECADISYEYDAPKMSGPGMIIAGRIESHFGIEDV